MPPGATGYKYDGGFPMLAVPLFLTGDTFTISDHHHSAQHALLGPLLPEASVPLLSAGINPAGPYELMGDLHQVVGELIDARTHSSPQANATFFNAPLVLPPNASDEVIGLAKAHITKLIAEKLHMPVAGGFCQLEVADGCEPLPEPDLEVLDTHTTDEAWSVGATSTSYMRTDMGNRHSADGVLGEVEWEGVTPAVGRFSNLYATYDGVRLHLLSDWTFHDASSGPLPARCRAIFRMWTGGGSERWQVELYASGDVFVRLNGELLPPSRSRAIAAGAVGFGPSPRDVRDHTVYELSLQACWGVWPV